LAKTTRSFDELAVVVAVFLLHREARDMPKRARFALKVNDLASSLIFYVDRLGFQLVESQLDEPRIVYKPGQTLDFVQENLDVRLAALSAHGLSDIHEEQTDEGDRKLTLKDPSNSTIIFVQQRSPEKTLALYSRGGDDIEAALTELSEADFDFTRAPGEWSIRQIVHHLAEMESLHLMIFASALAQSGSTFIRPPYDQDHWVEALAYNERAIEPSVALIKASRRYIAHLLQHIPDHWDRYVLLKFANWEGEGNKVTIGAFLDGLNWHFADHCAEIRETRRIHRR
jgi:catechol 2,3-dioxygenase-like lactoylglutathione lyase family enzyme